MENNSCKNLEVVEIKRNNDYSRKKSKFLLVFYILLIVISLILLGWSSVNYYLSVLDDDKVQGEVTPNIVESAYRISSNSLEKFDLTFLQLENEPKNKVYSPLSIKYALGMLSEGANGNSKTQIDSVIGDYKSKKYINSLNMSFANALFIRDTYKDSIKSSYIDILTNKYNAEVVYDSFESSSNLNNWVKNKTLNLVDNLEDNLNNRDFVLINALALDMEWKNRIQSLEEGFHVDYKHEDFSFNIYGLRGTGHHELEFDNSTKKVKSVEIGASINKYDIINELGEDNIRKTVEEAYKKYLDEFSDGNYSDVSTYLDKYIEDISSNYNQVASSTDFSFYDDEEVKVFAKDLQEYDDVTLQYIGIMPKNSNLKSYIENTDVTKISTIIKNLKDIKLENFEEGFVTKITGYIPMFNFEYELNLQQDLETMGISDIFASEKADLSNLTSTKTAYINSASHKSTIEFSNDGIKAAAATTVGGLGDASGGFQYDYDVPVKEINLTFDNPYLFLIRDKKTGEVWFMGTVYEPVEYVKDTEW
ncbi:MAG: serpin family protein [Firmicutes bacterium]|nr:serpin family protein [Bacillota bacterium]